MSRVQYTGHDPDGIILVLDGREIHVEQGKQVEVPAEIAKELDARDDWTHVKDPGGAKAKAAASSSEEE